MSHVAADAYYHRTSDGRFEATEATTGPWDARYQHGGPPLALIAHVVDAREANDGMRIARITMEILGPIGKSNIEIATRVLRPGRRIELIEARLRAEDRDVILAHVWRFADVTQGVIPVSEHRGIVAPLPGADAHVTLDGRTAAYLDSFEWRFVQGAFGVPGPAAAWARPRLPLLAGESPTPRDGLFALADSANGFSLELPFATWFSIPSSVTVSLARDPETEWVYLGAQTDIGPDGRGVTTGILGDERGVVGNIVQALMVAPR